MIGVCHPLRLLQALCFPARTEGLAVRGGGGAGSGSALRRLGCDGGAQACGRDVINQSGSCLSRWQTPDSRLPDCTNVCCRGGRAERVGRAGIDHRQGDARLANHGVRATHPAPPEYITGHGPANSAAMVTPARFPTAQTHTPAHDLRRIAQQIAASTALGPL